MSLTSVHCTQLRVIRLLCKFFFFKLSLYANPTPTGRTAALRVGTVFSTKMFESKFEIRLFDNVRHQMCKKETHASKRYFGDKFRLSHLLEDLSCYASEFRFFKNHTALRSIVIFTQIFSCRINNMNRSFDVRQKLFQVLVFFTQYVRIAQRVKKIA